MKEAIIEDEELGRLIVRVNLRAKSLVFRTKSDAVYVSVPSGTTMKEVKRAIEDLRSKLLASLSTARYTGSQFLYKFSDHDSEKRRPNSFPE